MSRIKSVLEKDHKAQIEYELNKKGFKKQIKETAEGISILREGCTIEFPWEHVKKITGEESGKDNELDDLIRKWVAFEKNEKLNKEDIGRKLSIEYGESGERLKELFRIVHGRTAFRKIEFGLLTAHVPFRYFNKSMLGKEYHLEEDKLEYDRLLADFNNAYDFIKSIDADLVYGNFSEMFYEDILAFARSPEMNMPLGGKKIELIVGVERNGYNNIFTGRLEATGFELKDEFIKNNLKKMADKFSETTGSLSFEKNNVKLSYYFGKGFKNSVLVIEGHPKNIGKVFNESIDLLEDA